MAAVKTFGERIADALVEDGLLFAKQVEELLEQQKKEGTRLLKIIIDKGLVTESDMAVSMGRVLNVPPVNLTRCGIAPELTDLLPRDVCHSHKVVPVSRLENKLFLAMADPLNVLAVDDVRRITRLEVSALIASEKAIMDKLHQIDTGKTGSMEDIINDANRQAEDSADADGLETVREVAEQVNLDQLAASTEEAPVIELANLILVQAIKDRASDIHIEPFEKMVRLRYRVDGVLIDKVPPPKNLQVPLISRLKIMSCLDIAERRLPQDGRMRVKVGGRDFDLRVSFLPTVHGEKVVLRILDKANLSASMDKIGMDPDTFRRFRAAVDAPHGLILVTGPTGSGKTTTLYSALNELNSPDYNIVTVEDPVEFQVPGINQVPTKKEIGLTFGNALRSILRQDPDIVMIGEIRDTETAEIAVEAALTGHQVLSTMHCNDAPGAIARLDDMGIAPFLISSSVILACAQRLMRKICPHCKEPLNYPATMFRDLGIPPNFFEGAILHRGRGCERCNNTGYAGRSAIVEAMTITDEIRKVIIARGSSMEIGKIAVSQGMKALRYVALDKVREGITTLEQTLVITASHEATSPALKFGSRLPGQADHDWPALPASKSLLHGSPPRSSSSPARMLVIGPRKVPVRMCSERTALGDRARSGLAQQRLLFIRPKAKVLPMERYEKHVFLLAEDSESDVVLMKEAFAKAGVVNPLHVVAGGDEAIAYLRGDPPYSDRETYPLPFVLLMDLKMPGKNGFEVLAWTRSQPNLRRLVIIVLTASSSAADADRAFELGANFYLTKPGPFKELVEMTKCLQDWLRLNHFPTI